MRGASVGWQLSHQNRVRPSLGLTLGGLWLSAVALAFTSACSCEEDKGSKNPPLSEPKGLSPLEDHGIPAEIGIPIYPPEGAVTPRPVVLVLSREPALCELARERHRGNAHVLCLPDAPLGSDAETEAAMKAGLKYLKEEYDPYVAGSPAHLLSDTATSSLGLSLMVHEPRVFAHAYLPGLEPTQLTSTLLYSLFTGGARTLVLGSTLGPPQQPLVAMAARGGLTVEAVGRGPEGWARALTVLEMHDPRLSETRRTGPRPTGTSTERRPAAAPPSETPPSGAPPHP